MAFDFSLHSVLKVRTLVEEREERLLQLILQEVATTRHAIENTAQRLGEARQADSSRAFAATDLQARYAEVEQLRQARCDLESRLAKLEQLRDVQMAKYSAARREREMLTDMREQQREAYDQQQAKSEQSVLDDTFSALSRRKR